MNRFTIDKDDLRRIIMREKIKDFLSTVAVFFVCLNLIVTLFTTAILIRYLNTTRLFQYLGLWNLLCTLITVGCITLSIVISGFEFDS